MCTYILTLHSHIHTRTHIYTTHIYYLASMSNLKIFLYDI